MICPYCGEKAVLKDSAVIYRRSFGKVYICAAYPVCDAYVGCHKGTAIPLGRLANKELREAKKAAHAAFDPLWEAEVRIAGRPRKKARNDAYQWLAEHMGIPVETCHIGMFDLDQCRKVVAIMEDFYAA